MKLKKGDTILVTTGKDRGKTGKIEKVLPKKGKIIITGINILKKHSRPSKKVKQGGIIEINAPVFASNVLLLCSRCNKPAKIKYKIVNKIKERICGKCGEAI